MSEQKKLIIDTLDKVDKAELPLFIHELKITAFMKLALGEISKETGDLLIETCNEYLKSLKEQKYIEEKLAMHRTAGVVDISKMKIIK